MRLNHPTEDELLRSVLTGGGIDSDSGLDRETEDALWAGAPGEAGAHVRRDQEPPVGPV
jgi:hypothetical protein